jgi:hypothetical protein
MNMSAAKTATIFTALKRRKFQSIASAALHSPVRRNALSEVVLIKSRAAALMASRWASARALSSFCVTLVRRNRGPRL